MRSPDHGHLAEAHRLQHPDDCSGVGAEPIRRIAIELVSRIEGARRAEAVEHVHVSLENQVAAGDAKHALQRQQGIAKMVEHA